MVNARTVTEWLDKNCADDGLTNNVSSFRGGAWYVPDAKRQEFLELYAKVYNSKTVQYLNFVVFENTWAIHPYLDVDFPSPDDFDRLKAINGMDDWAFYKYIVHEFGKALDVPEPEIGAAITFCKKPQHNHKFHLVCHDERFIMRKADMITKVADMAARICGPLQLGRLPPMRKQDELLDWVTPYRPNSITEPLQVAAFVDLTAPGIRPIGSEKSPKQTSFDGTYHIMNLSTRSRVTQINASQLRPHLLSGPNNDSNRRQRGQQSRVTDTRNLTEVPSLSDIGEADAESDEIDSDHDGAEDRASPEASPTLGNTSLTWQEDDDQEEERRLTASIQRPRKRKPADDHVRQRARLRQPNPEDEFSALIEGAQNASNVKVREPIGPEVGRIAHANLIETMESNAIFRNKFKGDEAEDHTLGSLVERNRFIDRVNKNILLGELKALHLHKFILNPHVRGTIYQLIKERTTNFAATVLFAVLKPEEKNGKKIQGSVAVEPKAGGAGYKWYIYNHQKHRWDLPEPKWPFRGALHAILRAFETVTYEFCCDHDLKWLDEGIATIQLHVVRRAINECNSYVSGGVMSRESSVYDTLACLLLNADPLRERKKRIADVMDENMWLLGFPDDPIKRQPGGVLELKPPYRFRPGRPDDYISKQMKDAFINFKDGMKDPSFVALFDEVMHIIRKIFPDKDTMTFFLRAAASALGGIPPELLIILTGHGENGKSMALKLLSLAFGDLYTSSSSNMMTEKRSSSTAANPQLVRFKGARLRVDEEPEENESLNNSYLKARFNDQTVRELFGASQQQTHFYRHFMCCNAIPDIRGADKSMTRRLLIIEMVTNFINRGQQKTRETDVAADKKVPLRLEFLTQVLVSYLVSIWKKEKGDIRLDGDAVPQVIQKKTSETFKDMNLIVSFIGDKLEKNHHSRMDYDTIHTMWKTYNEEHGENVKIKKDVFRRMLHFDFGEVPCTDGKVYYRCCRKGEGPTEANGEDLNAGVNPNILAGLEAQPSFDFLNDLIAGSDDESDNMTQLTDVDNDHYDPDALRGVVDESSNEEDEGPYRYETDEAADQSDEDGLWSNTPPEPQRYHGYTSPSDDDENGYSEPSQRRTSHFIQDDVSSNDDDEPMSEAD